MSTFGQYLAQFLAERKIDVIVIDNDEGRVERVKSTVAKGIVADATDRSTLESLGLNEADAVIVCLGEFIDASLLVVLYLKELGVDTVRYVYNPGAALSIPLCKGICKRFRSGRYLICFVYDPGFQTVLDTVR